MNRTPKQLELHRLIYLWEQANLTEFQKIVIVASAELSIYADRIPWTRAREWTGAAIWKLLGWLCRII